MAEKNTPAARRLFELKCGPLKVDYLCGLYSVCYLFADVKETAGLCIHKTGTGTTFEGACRDYLRQIRGETMVIRVPGCEWKEVEITG